MDIGKLIGYGLLGLIAWTILSTSCAPVPTLAGKEPVKTKASQLNWTWKGPADANGTMVTRNRSTGEPLGEYAVGADGVWHQTDEQRDHGPEEAEFTPSLYLGEWTFDVGPFLGVPFNATLDRDVQLGVRVSPARVAFGTIAPDFVASEEAFGLGISAFPPERAVGRSLSRFGAGAWYMVPWDGGRPGLVLGLSASNHY